MSNTNKPTGSHKYFPDALPDGYELKGEFVIYGNCLHRTVKQSSTTQMRITEFLKNNNFIFSKIIECKINNENIECKKNYCQIMKHINSLTNGAIKNIILNAKQAITKIVNICYLNSLDLKIQVKLKNGEIVQFNL